MSLNTAELLSRLHPVLQRLEADLLKRADDPGVALALAAEHAREVEARRTADPVEVWIFFRVKQIAAAWVLSLLFVRTLEDRDLIPKRLKDNDDHRAQLRTLAPYLNDRDYLLLVFKELTRYRGVRDVFDATHNPVWTLGPSADMAEALLSFSRSDKGLGGLDFSGDTRFLGDVYERLDEGVRARYALLQTPDFIESFILDQTLTPALAERGVEGLTLIDPTCGSGHFLLGAFERLFEAWRALEPSAGAETWAFKAIHQVFGVDINPYALAIARFRLVLAYVDAAGVARLSEAGDLRLNVAVADSLLPVEGAAQMDLAMMAEDAATQKEWHASPFALAQASEARRVLAGRSFDVVIGNPPYITVKDSVLRDVYREHYLSAYREYQLVVPFVERFFGLASEAGWVGAIVGNGFMKRLFGRKLIEEYLPKVDLTQIVDTSGAYIPGHGTPTIILFGRHRAPTSSHVLAVMGKRGEPSTPSIPAEGEVWSSIRENHLLVGYDDDYLSVDEIARTELSNHPWSIKGGGATKLKAEIESSSLKLLGEISTDIGFGAVTREDEVYIIGSGPSNRLGVPKDFQCPLVSGSEVRDWSIVDPMIAIWPYEKGSMQASNSALIKKALWKWRTNLSKRVAYGQSQLDRGLNWNEYSMFFRKRFQTPLTIAFAFVATHNHFVLDRGGKVFKQTAPIIKLPAEATEEDHLALLGYLNSSTACFWMKQVFFNKGYGASASGARTTATPWEDFYEFDGTKLKKFPLPKQRSPEIAQLSGYLDHVAQLKNSDSPINCIESAKDQEISQLFNERRNRQDHWLGNLVWAQEELDWYTYFDFGLCNSSLIRNISNLDKCYPFGRVLDRRIAIDAVQQDPAAMTWIRIHNWNLEAVIDMHSKTPLEEIEQKRLQAIETEKSINLCESSTYKRRWSQPNYAAEEMAACKTWLLNTLEEAVKDEQSAQSLRQLAQALARDPKLRAVAQIYTDQDEPDLETLFTQLIQTDAVPYLAALRYKPKGMIKRQAWEKTWAAQRLEDAGEAVDVPLPPKYGSGDFARLEYWRLRGKLDVPKERFILYPGAETPDDPSPIIGWAGWDHADRIAALGALLEEVTEPERRLPLMAGMLELLPWVKQWHGDDDRYGTPLGELWQGHLQGMMDAQGLTEDDLRAWRPAARVKKARAPRAAKAKAPELTREALLAAFAPLAEANEGQVTRAALAEALSAKAAAVGQAAQPLIDEGLWVVVKRRPVIYSAEDNS